MLIASRHLSLPQWRAGCSSVAREREQTVSATVLRNSTSHRPQPPAFESRHTSPHESPPPHEAGIELHSSHVDCLLGVHFFSSSPDCHQVDTHASLVQKRQLRQGAHGRVPPRMEQHSPDHGTGAASDDLGARTSTPAQHEPQILKDQTSTTSEGVVVNGHGLSHQGAESESRPPEEESRYRPRTYPYRRKKHYLRPGEDLILDWRPLFREMKALVLPQDTSSVLTHGGRTTRRNHRTLVKITAFAQIYFDPSRDSSNVLKSSFRTSVPQVGQLLRCGGDSQHAAADCVCSTIVKVAAANTTFPLCFTSGRS
ncbi:hypothetical protein MRB53_037331 [Persea americana]|nr:hypothetical protein MRB53_037331 [Persea americana]